MNKVLRSHFSLVATALLAVLFCSGLSAEESRPQFGPFEAISINSDVIKGVKVDEVDKIWLLLNPKYKEEEIRLKISNEQGSGYRDWFTGEKELISKANQGKAANEWTDWIRTESNYIEYWMKGQLILHLKRVR